MPAKNLKYKNHPFRVVLFFHFFFYDIHILPKTFFLFFRKDKTERFRHFFPGLPEKDARLFEGCPEMRNVPIRQCFQIKVYCSLGR